jgi:hypothetical protein
MVLNAATANHSYDMNVFCGNDDNIRGIPMVDAAHMEPNPMEADAVIAKELAKLSLQDREQAINDLHGVPEVIEEQPEFVSEKLHQLDDEINQIMNGTAYEQAEQQNKRHVQDRSFRLMFLRAELFQPKEAAIRIIRFFKEKLFLFGPEKLTKRITYDDLSEDDIESLECGALQVSPNVDRAGRKMLFGAPRLRRFRDITNFVSRSH